jgi:hypothetical protein
MRCALSFDENTALYEQKVKAWGELQSLDDEPAYKEEDIVDKEARVFFHGLKVAFETVANDLDDMVEDEEITEDASNKIQRGMCAELALHLFRIIDHQIAEGRENE